MAPVRQLTGFGAQHYYPPPIAWTRFALWVSMTCYSFGMVAVCADCLHNVIGSKV